jgi:hypothetical protein
MELRTHGPLYMLDGALSALRAGGAGLAAHAVLGAVPLALCVLALDYFEQVEGVRALRLPLSLAIVVGFLARSVALSRVARRYALLLRPTLPVVEREPAALEVATTAGIVGFGLLVWLTPLLLVVVAAPVAALMLWPFTALRGAVAPSWLARASCARERGGTAYGQAFDDTAGMRGTLALVELMLQLGALALLGNLLALVAILLGLGHSMFGLDVAFVSAFASPDNPWTLLSVSTLTLLTFEPLRAAVSAQAFVEARTRRDGADLHAAVDAAIESGRARAPARGVGAAALLWLAATGLCAPARAEPPPQVAEAPRATAAASIATATGSAQVDFERDHATRERVARILAQDEFREHTAGDGALTRWFEKLRAWLETLELQDDDGDRLTRTDEPGSPVTSWAVAGLLLITIAVIAWLLRAPGRLYVPALAGASAGDTGAGGGVRSAHEGEDGQPGDPRIAIRALYLSTLAALDREGRLELDPSKTNGQHLRALPSGPSRRALAELTRIFDRTWYGHVPATPEDLARGRTLAALALAADAPAPLDAGMAAGSAS